MVLAFGVACTVVANIVMNCGEAFVCAITSRTGWNFGHTKVGFDLGCVVLAVIASVALMGGVAGVREGTVIAAAATGFIVNAFIKLMGGVRPALGETREASPLARRAVMRAEQDTPRPFNQDAACDGRDGGGANRQADAAPQWKEDASPASPGSICGYGGFFRSRAGWSAR